MTLPLSTGIPLVGRYRPIYDHGVRDAEIIDMDVRGLRRIEMRIPPDVWLREGGRWRLGWVPVWFEDPAHKRLIAWCFRDVGKMASLPVNVVYDPETMLIRSRHEPPA